MLQTIFFELVEISNLLFVLSWANKYELGVGVRVRLVISNTETNSRGGWCLLAYTVEFFYVAAQRGVSAADFDQLAWPMPQKFSAVLL